MHGIMHECWSYEATSHTTILTHHSRLRREQRGIAELDLHAALEYGTKVWQKHGTYKIEYDGITYILDRTLQHLKTCFHSPLPLAPLDATQTSDHTNARLILNQRPDVCTSHTVIVIDTSGSMQTRDTPLYRDRQTAAYSTMALIVAEHLIQKSASNRDVVSLIEFDADARIVFEREPWTWVLYNKLLSRRRSGTYNQLKMIQQRELKRADSNYLPAIDLADELLEQICHDQCELALFFFSDGQPSDHVNSWTERIAQQTICSTMRRMAMRRDDVKLTVSLVGVGRASHDYSTLQDMSEACETLMGRASFIHCDNLAPLRTAATSRASLTQTCSSIESDEEGEIVWASEHDSNTDNELRFYQIVGHAVYSPERHRLVPHSTLLPPGAVENKTRHLQYQPPYLAMKMRSCVQGAERNAFKCRLSYQPSTRGMAFGTMMAKETSLMKGSVKRFCEAQSLASFLADKFNRRIRATQMYNTTTTPVISFAQCSVLLLKDKRAAYDDESCVEAAQESARVKSVLVEKWLDTDRFPWRKWNGNSGVVNLPPDCSDKSHPALRHTRPFDPLEESEEEWESDDESDETEYDFARCEDLNSRVAPEAYLEAFSHFTYAFTNREVLVCDLQGVFNTDTTPPTFELTEPTIYVRPSRGRYGHTDRRQAGMRVFLSTHQCSGVCRPIHMETGEKYWRKLWCQHHEKLYSDESVDRDGS